MENSLERPQPLRVNILDIVLVLFERKKLIVAFMAVVSVFAVVLSLVLPVYFRASVTLMPPKQSLPGGFANLLSSIPGSDLIGSLGFLGSSDADHFLSILQSRRLAESVIKKFDLAERYKFTKHKRYFIEDVIRAYRKSVRIEETDYGTIVVSVDDRDPKIAADIANFIAQELDAVNYELSMEDARYSRSFFEQRLSQTQKELDSVLHAMAAFKVQHNYLDLETQLRSTVSALAELESKIMLVDMEIAVQQRAIGSAAPTVRELVSQRTAMQKLVNKYMEEGNGNILIALRKSPTLAIEYAYLMRDAKIKEEMYKYLVQMYEQAKFQEVNDIPVVKILESAQVPEKKVRPKRSIICILTFFVGFVFIAVLVMLGKLLESHRIRQSETWAKIDTLLSQIVPVRLRR